MSNDGPILITGGSGFLGRAVDDRLHGALVWSSEHLDLTDSRKCVDAIASLRPRIVVHLAARVGGITANIARQADFLVDNLRMDANLLAALRHHPPDHLIAMLSTCMYPDRLPDEKYPMTEDLIEAGPPPKSNAAYAAAKRALWHGTQALNDQYGVPFTALVPANLYGPGDHFGQESSHFLAAAVTKIERAREAGAAGVTFFGTGRALRQYVFVEDLADLIALIIERGPVNATLNVAPRHNLSIRQLAETVGEAAGYTGEITFSGHGPDGQLRKDVSSDALRQSVRGWDEIETGLMTGLKSTIEWYREHVEASQRHA